MNGQEFAAYMPPTALVDTIAHVWGMGSENDNEAYVLRVCFDALVTAVDATEACEMVESKIGDSMIDFLAVVS